MPAGAGVLSVEFKINLLAPGDGELLIATGEVVKPGKTLVIARGEVYVRQGRQDHPLRHHAADADDHARHGGEQMNSIGLDFDLGDDIDMLRDSVAPLRRRRDRAARRRDRPRQRSSRPTCGASSATSACSASPSTRNTAARRMGYLAHIVAMEEISRASASVGCPTARIPTCASTRSTATATRRRSSKYLPRLITGEHVGALAMSEPDAGSDVVRMKLRADQKGDRYVLNGTKMWITNGGRRRHPGRLCQDRRGRRRRRASPPSSSRRASRASRTAQKLDKLGMRGSNTWRAGVRGLRGAGRERARPASAAASRC